jgi:hypothetical protein
MIKCYVCFCTVLCNVCINTNQKKCTFPKLIFLFNFFFLSSTCLGPKGSSSGRRLYIQLQYRTFYTHWYKQSSR